MAKKVRKYTTKDDYVKAQKSWVDGQVVLVSELIEMLKKMPQDARVIIPNKNQIDMYGMYTEGDVEPVYNETDEVVEL